MKLKDKLDDKIVLFGQSCVGKTTFAKELHSYNYYCFDAMFHWHLIETFGLSIRNNMLHLRSQCVDRKFVLDGWHLSDSKGEFLPFDAKVYVIYATYDQIVSQYRVKVYDPEEYREMYKKWYLDIMFDELPGVRYFRNQGEFVECDRDEFSELVSNF